MKLYIDFVVSLLVICSDYQQTLLTEHKLVDANYNHVDTIYMKIQFKSVDNSILLILLRYFT